MMDIPSGVPLPDPTPSNITSIPRFDRSPIDPAYHNQQELTQDTKVKGNERRFLCDICGARFSRRSSLWNHKKIHSETRPYICPTCKNCFKWKNSLKGHQEMHARKGEPCDVDDNEESGGKRRRTVNHPGTVDLAKTNVGEDVTIGREKSVDSKIEFLTAGAANDHNVDHSIVQLPSLKLAYVDGMESGKNQPTVWNDSNDIEWPSYTTIISCPVQDDAVNSPRNPEMVTHTCNVGTYAKVLPCHLW